MQLLIEAGQGLEITIEDVVDFIKGTEGGGAQEARRHDPVAILLLILEEILIFVKNKPVIEVGIIPH